MFRFLETVDCTHLEELCDRTHIGKVLVEVNIVRGIGWHQIHLREHVDLSRLEVHLNMNRMFTSESNRGSRAVRRLP